MNDVLAALEANLLAAREAAIWNIFEASPTPTWAEVLGHVTEKTKCAEIGAIDIRLRYLVGSGQLRLHNGRLMMGTGPKTEEE